MSQLNAIQDVLLSNVSSAYFPKGTIADLIFPAIKSKEKTGKLGKYGKNHLRIEHSLSGGRAAYKRVEPIVRSTDSYSIETHGLEGLVTEDDYRNVQLPFKAEEDETKGVTSLIMLDKEYAVSQVLANTSVLTQNATLAGGDQWSAFGTSDPLDDASAARQAVYSGCGELPNVAITSWEVVNKLAYHPGILDALGYTQARAGQLNEQELAKALGVQKLLVGSVSYNSAKEGQTDVLASVWGKHMVFAVLPESAQPYQNSLGYKVVLEDSPQRRVFKYAVNNPPNATGILVDDSYQFLISNALCAYLYKNVVA